MNVHRLLPSVDNTKLSDLIDTHCRVHMVRLLDRIAHKFPNAKVVVTGYYPIISEASDFGLLKVYLSTLGFMTGTLAAAATPSFVAATRFVLWRPIAPSSISRGSRTPAGCGRDQCETGGSGGTASVLCCT